MKKIKRCTIRTFVNEEEITCVAGLEDDFRYNDMVLVGEKGFAKKEYEFGVLSSTFTYEKGNVKVTINVWYEREDK